MQKPARISLLLLISLMSFSACAQAGKDTDNKAKEIEKTLVETPATPAKFQRPAGFLNDLSELLSDSDKSEIENVLRELRDKAQVDFGIAIIDSTNGKDIFNYSLELAREWKIGAKNGGALLVIAFKDRKWHIQIDKRLETDLSNEEVKNIGEVMMPDFKEGKHGDGIKKCVEKMIVVLAAKQHFAPIKFKTPEANKQ